MNEEKTLTIGRARDCDIVFSDGTVSGRHAQLTFLANGKILLTDLGSTNGTKLAGRDIRSEFLSPTDVVEFGRMRISARDLLEAVRLRFPNFGGNGGGQTGGPVEPDPPKEPRVHGPELVRCECGAVIVPGTRCKECGR